MENAPAKDSGQRQRQISPALGVVFIVAVFVAIVVAAIVMSCYVKPPVEEECKGIVCQNSMPGEYLEEEAYGEGERITDLTITSITLRYYAGYNIASGNAISDIIPLNTVELTGYNLYEVARQLDRLRFVDIDKNSEEYEHLKYDNIFDTYELVINDEMTLYIGNEYGAIASTGNPDGDATIIEDSYFKVPLTLFQKITTIANDYSNENLYQKLNSANFEIVHDGETRILLSDEYIRTLSAFRYYIINDTPENYKDEEVAYLVMIDGDRTVKVFRASCLGLIEYPDGKVEVVYIDGLEDYLDGLFEV